MTSSHARPDVDQLVQGVRGGDRGLLARAITLIESNRPEHQLQAEQVLARLLPHTGAAHRVGITGVPGVGKSTFIETLGLRLLEAGHRVAVLAIDPSSTVSGGSILGDKTRMNQLAADDRAFIRPTPSAATLGGVARRTREVMLLCEAAGHDVVLVETVGVGQSETVVAEMVDCFVLLMIAGAGDELQGIKRGVMELADLVVVNKADGDNLERAQRTAREVAGAMKYLRPRFASWTPEVLTASAVTGDGLDELWAAIERHRAALDAAGDLDDLRRAQVRSWIWNVLEQRLLTLLHDDPALQALIEGLERQVLSGTRTPTAAADELLRSFLDRRD
jgi:LAO/AO transport system kinase